MRAMDIAASLAMLGLCAIVWFATWSLPVWTEFSPGPGFAPFGVATIGALLACLLLLQALRREDDVPVDWPDVAGGRNVTLVVLSLWAVVAASGLLGLVPVTALMCLFLLLVVERRPLFPSLFATAITIALVYGVFVAWLGVALPTGILGV
jgi:putative tricarboxylic transport membrane protein